jgi:hypothetical protein
VKLAAALIVAGLAAALIVAAGCLAVARMPSALAAGEKELGDFTRRHEYRRRAERTIAELEQKHAGVPFERWPAEDRARHAAATSMLKGQA